MQGLTVTQLARAADVGGETVRHYEALGLLPAPQRTASGYRLFSRDAVPRLAFIRRSKALGFTLPEIKELLNLSDLRQTDCNTDMLRLREAATEKLQVIDGRINELKSIRQGLQDLISSCPGKGPLANCPILSALSVTTTDPHRSADLPLLSLKDC